MSDSRTHIPNVAMREVGTRCVSLQAGQETIVVLVSLVGPRSWLLFELHI